MTKLQFPSLTKGQQLAEIYDALGGTMDKRFFEVLSEDQQMAEIWEQIGAPAPGGGLPDQTGEGGSFLRTNGTDAAWSTDGSGFTDLDATQLIGTIPDGNFPETLPIASGENLIALNGAFIASGNIAAARITTALTTAQPMAATTLSANTISVTTINANGGHVTVGPTGVGTNLILKSGAITNASFDGVASAFTSVPVTLSSTLSFGWSTDLFLWRDAANTLAQRNGTAAQTLRVYNTFTNASNYERAFIRWATNVCEIGTSAAGTGTLRALNLIGSALQINGAAGATATLTSITSITVTNGIVTAIVGT